MVTGKMIWLSWIPFLQRAYCEVDFFFSFRAGSCSACCLLARGQDCSVCENSSGSEQCVAALNRPDFCRIFCPILGTVTLCMTCLGHFNRSHHPTCLLSSVAVWNSELEVLSVAKDTWGLILGSHHLTCQLKAQKTRTYNYYRNDMNVSETCLFVWYCLIFAVSLWAEKEVVVFLHVIKSLFFGNIPLEGWERSSPRGLHRCVGFFISLR